MPIMFNTILRQANVPIGDVRLLRHKDRRASKGNTPYELWKNNREEFERYQSTQNRDNRKKLCAPYWAVFIVNPSEETMFGGLYAVKYKGPLPLDAPHSFGKPSDWYDLTLQDLLSDLIGKLFIEWGKAALAWAQYAHRNEKAVIELRREFSEPTFPGFLNFIRPLSRLDESHIPKSWIAALQSSRGVYLFTCPKTKEQYVGSATGEDGFWGRWQDYVGNGHGGNVGLKLRDPSDYQVSILEVAGTSATSDDIRQMEGRWQSKLQSLEMGLNRNLAGRHD